MGHLVEKYDRQYFLGGKDPQTGLPYGLSGYLDYKKNKSHHRFHHALQFIKSVVRNLQGKNILEIGFGRGELIPYLLNENCGSYHGIDFSKEAVRIANRHTIDPEVTLEVMDAKDINLSKMSSSYDVVIMNDVVEYIPPYEMEIVWKKIKACLRKDGHLIIGTSIYDNLNELSTSEHILSTMGMSCNKQNEKTLLEACVKHGFICHRMSRPFYSLVMKDAHPKAKMVLSGRSSMSSRRLIIGCVAENSPKYRSQALKLVQSIRWFGGKIAGAALTVCMVDEVDSRFAQELKKWGVFVQVVKRFSKIHAPSNKIRYLELPQLSSYDTIMLMDCDTAVLSDPSPYIKEGYFQATMAGMVNVSDDNFKQLFSHYHLQMPDKVYKTTIKDEPTIWYCNAGVLIFPQKVLASFLDVWKGYIYDLYDHQNLLDKFFFCEQVALTLAFIKHPIPFKELPKTMNYHLNPKILHRNKHQDPAIIHYHRYFNKKGFIMEPKNDPHVLKKVKRFNKFLKKYRRFKKVTGGT